jgi:multidrug resistance efflux pump
MESKRKTEDTQELKNNTLQSASAQKGGKDKIAARIRQHPKAVLAMAILAVLAVVAGAGYLIIIQGRAYIEKAEINAPVIMLGPKAPGVIDKLYVKEGDRVHKDQVLAVVGNEMIRARTAGIITYVKDTPGQLSGPQDTVVKMVEPKEFRLLGRIEEDKGLSDVKVGQRVIFTVDAFGSKEYEGVVDSIAPSARQSDVVFSISDKREVREFDIKAKFDLSQYPELKNGMSAKMWVYK